MSMTLEEAIKLLKQYQGYEPMFPDGETLKHSFDLTDETVDTLLAALRHVSRERVKRKADARALVPCPGCGGENIVDCYRHNEVWYQCDDCGWQGPSVYSEGFADTEKARLAWNTRAPILSKSEMEMLEGTE